MIIAAMAGSVIPILLVFVPDHLIYRSVQFTQRFPLQSCSGLVDSSLFFISTSIPMICRFKYTVIEDFQAVYETQSVSSETIPAGNSPRRQVTERL